MKKKVAQMGCRAVEKTRKWDVAHLKSCADGGCRAFTTLQNLDPKRFPNTKELKFRSFSNTANRFKI